MKWVAYNNGVELPYWLGLLIALDQFLNAFFPGAQLDETVSSRLGRMQQKAGGSIPWWPHPWNALLSRLLDKIDPGHCRRAIGY